MLNRVALSWSYANIFESLRRFIYLIHLQAVVQKKAGGQAQQPVHYGHANQEENDSREY